MGYRNFYAQQKGSKGVDISLSIDMLSHAFHDHYDAALLFSADGDYKPLVEAVQRLGKFVIVCAFQSGLSKDLKLAADRFFSLDSLVSSLPVVTT